jgi:hypothetical protein
MSLDLTTIDAEAFPLFTRLGPSLMLMLPVDRDAVPGLDEAYTEASLDSTTGIQDAGTTIDAHWKVEADHLHVLLVLKGRAPKPFQLAVRFPSGADDERQFFTGLAAHAETGPVSLSIYPDKEDVARAVKALADQDATLFASLGIGVESEMHCRTLLRLNRSPR